VQHFQFKAAKATARYLTKTRLCESKYTGPMTTKALEVLCAGVIGATLAASAYVVRLDKALVLANDPLPFWKELYQADAPAGAMIVRPEQYDYWTDFALRASRFGVVRTVWTPVNAQLAYEWALRRSHIQESQR
jgi:hypothetical protein